jgi:hypothetical protein
MRYVAGSDLSLLVPLADADGNPITATAAEFAVFDGNDVALVPFTPITPFTPGESVTVEVSELTNTIAAGVLKEVRVISVRCATSQGIKMASLTYILESQSGTLVRGVNTLVSLGTADMLAADMTRSQSWTNATRQQKINALIEAFARLGKLRLTPIDDDGVNGYVNKNPFKKTRSTSITDLSVTEILALDGKFLAALSYAQVAEADVILSGDSIAERRREGLVADTIGEVKQQYKNGKPLELPISRRALDYLTPYTSLGVKAVGRG